MITVALVVILSGPTIFPPSPDPRPSDGSPTLTMSPAVVCVSVDGYRAFVKRPHPVLTKDEKLMLYFEPRGHTFTQKEGVYKLHLTEDVELRHRGASELIQKQENLVEFDEIANRPPVQIYLMNQIELKKLTPGEYDLTIILHDELGDSATASQVVRFSIKEEVEDGDSTAPRAAPEQPEADQGFGTDVGAPPDSRPVEPGAFVSP